MTTILPAKVETTREEKKNAQVSCGHRASGNRQPLRFFGELGAILQRRLWKRDRNGRKESMQKRENGEDTKWRERGSHEKEREKSMKRW